MEEKKKIWLKNITNGFVYPVLEDQVESFLKQLDAENKPMIRKATYEDLVEAQAEAETLEKSGLTAKVVEVEAETEIETGDDLSKMTKAQLLTKLTELDPDHTMDTTTKNADLIAAIEAKTV